MSKRVGEVDSNDGPSAKSRREEPDDGGGRTGRVRKKSAKVLEMEEFEQVEKTQHSSKKTKQPKTATQGDVEPLISTPAPKQKVKVPKSPAVTPKSTLAANLMQTPISVTPTTGRGSKSGGGGAKSVGQFLPVQSSGILTSSNSTEMLAAVIKKEAQEASQEETDEQQQSVIKYLLNSPASGSKSGITSPDSGSELVGGSVGKKSASKKAKVISTEKTGGKSKSTTKVKLEPDADSFESFPSSSSGLKIKISASSDPHFAQVIMSSDELAAQIKSKKSSKKSKESLETVAPIKTEPEEPGSPTTKKSSKKGSKKKERLIQDAITAAQQAPVIDSPPLPETKMLKKKKKVNIVDELGPGELYDDGREGSNLVIAETVMKKKKTLTKKKSALKGDPGSEENASEKKLNKRAPTAYMLFCNTHRPTIVNENPGIEFAGISRKLGELWQTLSTKQKLQWRKKAQRRMKRGSNLISTGKSAKDSASQPGSGLAAVQQARSGGSVATSAASGLSLAASNNVALRILEMANRSPVETPQSPTKLNFSIEPVDVAAHLKLLGESLSIIGMRLQEHKGMIAVQGSLSVLLDSLLCACGPLLCLTQQVPDMDGCDPVVHGQTLDSVAYVMPGL